MTWVSENQSRSIQLSEFHPDTSAGRADLWKYLHQMRDASGEPKPGSSAGTRNPRPMRSQRTLSTSILPPLLLAGLLSLTGTVFSHATHYRVYLLGGQSNANGRANAAKLTGKLASAQNDIRFYWNRKQATQNVGHLAENTWIDLAPGSGHGRTAPVFPMEFGPELSFGRAMADAKPGEHIALIKFSVGGSNLYGGWAEKGPLYTTFVATVKAGLADLTRSGDTYELGGMLWQQGENDANPKGAGVYEANLTKLILRVRKDLFGGREAPFVIGSLSDSHYRAAIRTPGNPVHKVRQAQETAAARMRAVGLVNTDGFSMRPSDTIHFDHNGQLALGRAFAATMLKLEADGDASTRGSQ